MKHLFPGFLDDALVYDAALAYWQRTTSEAAAGLPYADKWELLPPSLAADGTTIIVGDPGDPILAAQCVAISRGYRISQYEAMGSEWDPRDLPVVGWVNDHGCEHPLPEEWARHVLWLGLVLTEDTADLSSEVLRAWMNPSTTIEAMKAILRDRCNGPG